MSKKVKLLIAVFCFISGTSLFAQGITTAGDYFKSVSDKYATIKDYEAQIEMVAINEELAGRASFLRPNLLRIDFSNPQDQVILFNGDNLIIYLPNSSAVLQQSIKKDNTGASSANFATPQGLSLMRRYYSVAYEVGQDAVPLENGSDEKVVKLVLTRRNSSEAFRHIKLAINEETKLIRRVEAVTPKGETFIFNFMDYKINQGISDQRFIYDPPSSANNFNNFLFSE